MAATRRTQVSGGPLAAALLLAGLLNACGLAPRQPVLPYPDHVRAAIAIGDRIDVVMQDGARHTLIVTDIGSATISGDDIRIPLGQVAALSKRSWHPARNPCDDGEPLQCSTPALVAALSEFYDRYNNEFQPSCAAHDFCYRYGRRTYGHNRAACDERFLDDMKSQCSGRLELDPLARAECQVAARHLYAAVVRHGAPAYHDDDSRYCEYAGPPASR